MGQATKKKKMETGHTKIYNIREKVQYRGPSFYFKKIFLLKIRSRYARYGFMACDVKEEN